MTPNTDSTSRGRPTLNDLSGIPINKDDSPPKEVEADHRPTADQLAGISVAAEGPEDLTVRPRKVAKKA